MATVSAETFFFVQKFDTMTEAYRFKNCCQDSNVKHISVQFELSYYHNRNISKLIH
jgi:hypothetical protein